MYYYVVGLRSAMRNSSRHIDSAVARKEPKVHMMIQGFPQTTQISSKKGVQVVIFPKNYFYEIMYKRKI